MPQRGEVWWFDPDPVRGHELGRKVRPALVISTNDLHRTGLGKVIIVRGTSNPRPTPLHVPFAHTLRGAPAMTFFCCEEERSIDAAARLRSSMGPRPVHGASLGQVEQVLRLVLGL